MIPTKLKMIIVLVIATILYPTLGFSMDLSNDEQITVIKNYAQNITGFDIVKLAKNNQSIECIHDNYYALVPFDGTALCNIRFAADAIIRRYIDRKIVYTAKLTPQELVEKFPNLIIYPVFLDNIDEIWLKVIRIHFS